MPISIDEFKGLEEKTERGSGVSNEDLLESLSKQAMTTKEVAEVLSVQNGTAFSRLRRLMKDALVERKFKGNVGYWVATGKAPEAKADE